MTGLVSKLRVVVPVALGLALVGGVAAAVVGTPQIDNANVSMTMQQSPAFRVTRCTGVAGIPYETWRGGWKGSETDVTPGSTMYNLSGTLTIQKVLWTINLKTDRGVLTGTAILTSPASGQRVYAGPLTLITQNLPNSDRPASARGWLAAPTYTQGQLDKGKILANVEMQISNTFAANGGFGDAGPTFGTPSYAVATNTLTC
jgi:hypothetical protein